MLQECATWLNGCTCRRENDQYIKDTIFPGSTS